MDIMIYNDVCMIYIYILYTTKCCVWFDRLNRVHRWYRSFFNAAEKQVPLFMLKSSCVSSEQSGGLSCEELQAFLSQDQARSHDGFRWSESWEQTAEIYTAKKCSIVVEGRWHVPCIHYLYGISLDMTSLLGPRPPIIMIWRKEFHNLFTYLRVLQAQYGRILQSFLMNDCSSPHHSGKRKNSEWNRSHFELIPFSNEPAACWRVY